MRKITIADIIVGAKFKTDTSTITVESIDAYFDGTPRVHTSVDGKEGYSDECITVVDALNEENAVMMNTRIKKTSIGFAYHLPTFIASDSNWEDTSYGNDELPSYTHKETGIMLWIDEGMEFSSSFAEECETSYLYALSVGYGSQWEVKIKEGEEADEILANAIDNFFDTVTTKIVFTKAFDGFDAVVTSFGDNNKDAIVYTVMDEEGEDRVLYAYNGWVYSWVCGRFLLNFHNCSETANTHAEIHELIDCNKN